MGEKTPPAIDASHIYCCAEGEAGTVDIVSDVSLTVSRGEFISIVGPSGCGKTTFLNVIAGVDRPTRGTILVNGGRPEPTPRRVSYMFARDALLPWRTAFENVALPLELLGVLPQVRRRRVEELLNMVGLSGLGGRYRAELSQGMRQRVALARVLAAKPELLVMDEPFAALDAQTRVVMQTVLLEVLAAEVSTVVFVTHDLEEAILLSDRVVLFSRRPCRVRAVVPIPFNRPRDISQLRVEASFHELYAQLWEPLRAEVEDLWSETPQC